ncbi:DUF3732 domain-containing protein [Bacillus sp. FJAT-27245]|uniref:DUF3732 domain-containing protein n=1 Tax=Bacillus sp. FJAT-27245 TaxID=1684144 RepID=UPI0006A7BEDE|nr:DUF3732 domain-containing protein [Bacillus sp. FJAT-27245]
MKSYIKSIILLNKHNEKRYITLKRGLNIITGQSKSGKSSLIEIIDYCLGSTQPTIPKGVITEFAYIYAILIEINDSLILLGRKNFNQDGRKFIYMRFMSNSTDVKDIDLGLFTDEFRLKISNAKMEISKAFGITVTNSTESAEETNQGRPSIRDMVSFLFQHQNLIANKFALFYRFENSKKRERVIKLFPVFAGWVDQNYYSLIYRLDELRKEKKRLSKSQEALEKTTESLKQNLIASFEKYYFLIGEKFHHQDKGLQYLLELRKQLPDPSDDAYTSDELENNYYHKKHELEILRSNKHELEMKVRDIIEGEKLGNHYKQNLEMLNEKKELSRQGVENYVCPICGNKHYELTEKANEVNMAKEWLENELSGLNYYTTRFEEEMNVLKKDIKILKNSIKEKEKELNEIEHLSNEIKEKKHLDAQQQYAKARIDIECMFVEKQIRYLVSNSIDEILSEIEYIKNQISGYDIESYYKNAFYTINGNMNRIIDKLDFEEEFLPANLKFKLETFDLYHHDKKNNEKIYLSEMGSGANWLACHVGLFLSLITYFSSQRYCPVPSLLFIDQPSQVYFPDIFDQTNTKDIEAVQKIYITILEELDKIFKEVGFYPQVIVTDHVDNLDLGNYNFNDYVRSRWWNEKFI